MKQVLAVALALLMVSSVVAQEDAAEKPFDPAAEQTQFYLRFMQAQINQELKRAKGEFEAVVKKHGEDSVEALEARARLKDIEQRAAYFKGNPAEGAPLSSAAIQSAMMQRMLQYQTMNMMRYMEDSGGYDDSIATGRQMVMEGLNLQLEAMAQQIKNVAEEGERESLRANLKETVGMVVAMRAKLRKQQIERLEKQLAELRKETEGESAEAMLKRLLGSPKANEKKEDKE